MLASKAVTVSQLNSYLKVLLESDINLQNLFISGEISNFKKHYPSGHLYFSLKDEKSVIKAIMFAGYAKCIPFEVSNGMKVIVRGRVSCYEPSGQYQVYVQDIEPQGIGSVYLAFKQLEEKLRAEGLFDESVKKALPLYPKKIGVVTSRTGAVIHDIKNVAFRRYPVCEIVLYPVEVQGEKAALEIARAFNYFNLSQSVDVIIVGRGGGSLEELWAFNKEEVARAIYSSKIPVISAVGHETDFTICDFVADHRASTPSAAAEIATPDKNNLQIMISDYQKRIKNEILLKINYFQDDLKQLKDDLKQNSPMNFINLQKERLDLLQDRLRRSFGIYLSNKIRKYELLKKSLTFCSQDLILKKGYALVFGSNGHIKSKNDLDDNTPIEIKFSDGTAKGYFKRI